MYYNDVTNDAVPDGQCGTCVFDVNNGFNGVWHLDDVAALSDATSRGNTGTNTNTNNTTGIINGAINSTTAQFIDFPNASVSDLNQEVTISFWSNGDAPTLPG